MNRIVIESKGERVDEIKTIDDADYRGCTIQYEVCVYGDHWEIFTNRAVFYKRMTKEKGIKQAEELHDMLINDMFNKHIITDAKPLLRDDIHLFKKQLRRDVAYSKPHEYKTKRINGKTKFIQIPKTKKR